MTLVTGGTLWMVSTTDGNNRSILYEISGGGGSPPTTLNQLATSSDPSIGTLPHLMSDFYGHTQGTLLGRAYCTNNWTTTAYYQHGTGNTYSSPTSDNTTLKLTSVQSSVVCSMAEGPLGQAFGSGTVSCTLERRTKQTGGGWSSVTSWADYTSQTYTCDFSTYDYLWTITTY
jgi:hypothetical protein